MQTHTITSKSKSQLSLGLEKSDRMAARKALANTVADIYDSTAYWQYAGKIRGCADGMIVRRYEGDKQEIAYTLFCGCRLCPICGWRRSLKAYNQLSRCMDYMDEQREQAGKKPYAYLLITLTMRNCSGEDLPEVITHLTDSYVRLNNRKEWGAIKGAWRTLEVTYNPEADTYHPHLHIIAAVSPSYFKSRKYIPEERLIDLWQQALKVAYRPSVDIRKVKVSAGRKDLHEVTKYATKSGQIATSLPEAVAIDVLQNLHGALHGRKLFAAYGVIRKARRALHMSDEDGQLLDVTDSADKLAAEIRADLKWTLEAHIYKPGQGYVRYDDFALLVNPDAIPPHLKRAMAAIQAADHGAFDGRALDEQPPEDIAASQVTMW